MTIQHGFRVNIRSLATLAISGAMVGAVELARHSLVALELTPVLELAVLIAVGALAYGAGMLLFNKRLSLSLTDFARTALVSR